MIIAVTHEPVDLAFAAVVGSALVAWATTTIGRARAARRDPWFEAVLTARAIEHGRQIRARRRARWARTPVPPPE